jgi:hypothetical protein
VAKCIVLHQLYVASRSEAARLTGRLTLVGGSAGGCRVGWLSGLSLDCSYGFVRTQLSCNADGRATWHWLCMTMCRTLLLSATSDGCTWPQTDATQNLTLNLSNVSPIAWVGVPPCVKSLASSVKTRIPRRIVRLQVLALESYWRSTLVL